MRVCVTGATGLVGANTVRAFLDAGWDVQAGVRGASKTMALDGLPIERVSLDVEDRASLERAFVGCDIVVHAAAMVHVGRTRHHEMLRANAGGTENICAAAGAAGVRRVIHVSSVVAIGVRDDHRPATEEVPPNLEWTGCGYAASKVAAQRVVDRFVAEGLDVVVVNPTYMFGPWDTRPSSGKMILEVARGRAIVAPPGVNCFVDVRDVATGILRAVDRGKTGQKYILGGEGLSYFDVWTRIARIVGARPPLVVAPAHLARLGGRVVGRIGRWLGDEPEVNAVSALWSTLPNFWFSSDRARRELQFPETDLDRAISDAWRWFGQHGYA